VQDGAPEMWNRTREGMQALRAQGHLESWHEAIDRYHLMERLDPRGARAPGRSGRTAPRSAPRSRRRGRARRAGDRARSRDGGRSRRAGGRHSARCSVRPNGRYCVPACYLGRANDPSLSARCAVRRIGRRCGQRTFHEGRREHERGPLAVHVSPITTPRVRVTSRCDHVEAHPPSPRGCDQIAA